MIFVTKIFLTVLFCALRYGIYFGTGLNFQLTALFFSQRFIAALFYCSFYYRPFFSNNSFSAILCTMMMNIRLIQPCITKASLNLHSVI